MARLYLVQIDPVLSEAGVGGHSWELGPVPIPKERGKHHGHRQDGSVAVSMITSWKLSILDSDNLIRFCERIGLNDAGKAGTPEAMLDSYRKHGSESPRRSWW